MFVLKWRIIISLTPSTICYGLRNIIKWPIVSIVSKMFLANVLFFIISFSSNLSISSVDTLIGLKSSSFISFLMFTSSDTLTFNSSEYFSNSQRLSLAFKILLFLYYLLFIIYLFLTPQLIYLYILWKNYSSIFEKKN